MNPSSIRITSFLFIVREFLKALKQKHTYSIWKNWYCLFGILWGMPIPIITMGIDLHVSGMPFDFMYIIHTLIEHPMHIFFIMHPVFFAVVFGAMGTVRYNKDKEIEAFEKNLISKNEELERINKKLHELDELKSNFLMMVSHELRTPLTTILGYISFLKEKACSLTDDQMESLTISEDEAVRLNHLIEELLDLAKIETGKFTIDLHDEDIVKIVKKVIRSFQPSASKHEITLKNKLPDKLPFIIADDERIVQVISNLIDNAIKFNRPGGTVTISSIECKDEPSLTLAIADTGIGIEQDKRERIFDTFYQVGSFGKREHGGCGLGLAISKRIVELHHGRVWVESKPGMGSTFFVQLKKTA